MSNHYHVTLTEIEAHTEVEISWTPSTGQFNLSIGDPCNRISILLDPVQLERLASVIRVAQAERDIATGRVVPDDGDGPVLGSAPVSPEEAFRKRFPERDWDKFCTKHQEG